MAGINQDIVFAITQIETVFSDDIGNPPATGVGTGFFLKTEGGFTTFVTNRHNVDPSLNPRARKMGSGAKLTSVSIRLRYHDDARKPVNETTLVPLALPATTLRHSIDADVSVFIRPVFQNLPPTVGFHSINARELATQETLTMSASMADVITFVGFPGSPAGLPWFDTQWHTPVGRLAGIASRADLPFTNPQIPTADVTLVSGLSFRGSSGSPVFLHYKPAGGVGQDLRSAQPMVLGIMSGHWWEDADEPGMFHHSGLSYFTRATAIRALLAGIP